MTTLDASPAIARVRPRTGVIALVLFCALWALYQVSGTVLDEGDAVPSANIPVALFKTGRLSFDPEGFPEMFKWKTRPPFYAKEDFFFTHWSEQIGDQTAREWHEQGKLLFNGPRYYVVESTLRHTFVSTFGPIPGLLLVPFVAPFYAIDPDLAGKLALRATIARIGSSAFVAAVAVLVFLIALRFTTRRRALLLSATYGLGTCAWAISSQNMWQQTVTQLFLTLGVYWMLDALPARRAAVLSGLAFGIATASRATCAAVALAVLVHLLVEVRGRDKRNIQLFVLGLLPAPIAIGLYNLHYFGNPLVFAQELIGHTIAMEKTGSPALWQTPIWRGALGLLVSPSRGLLVFSPILAPAFAGMYLAWRDARYAPLRPLTIAALGMMAVQCRWFDWWGGHAYGYRPWLDVVPFLVLFMLPVVEQLTLTRGRQVAYAAVLAWCAFVQGLGALSYDRSWNLRNVFVVRIPTSADAIAFVDETEARRFAESHDGTYLGNSWCDIDLWFCRHRLWSVRDNVIEYQFSHFQETRSRRLPAGFADLSRGE